MARLKAEIRRRKEAEKTLKESEERYKTVIDNVNMGIALISPQMEVLSINKALKNQFPDIDLSRRPICYKVFCNSPQDRICSSCPTTQSFEDGDVHEVIGETIPGRIVRRTSSPIKDADGKIIAVVEMSENATEDTCAQLALRESEQRYRDLAELLPEVVFETDLAGRLTFVNQRGFTSFGYAPEEFEEGIDIMGVLVPEDRDRAARRIYALLEGEKPAGNEYTMSRKDGTTFPAIVSAIPVVSEGKPVGFRGVVIDITQVKQSALALSESENKFRNLTEGSAVGVYLVQDGIFRYVNPSFAKMHGFTVEELVDKKGPKDLVLKEDWPLVRDWVRRSGSATQNGAIRFRGRTGSRQIIQCEAYGSQTQYRGKPAAIGTVLDVTERVRSEEQIIALNSLASGLTHAADLQEALEMCLDTALHSPAHGRSAAYAVGSREQY